ncbi:putative homogentisate -dioxygenase protein [Phaeoacremonium minimum UCRPA7]|uniref:homogentisate 1,2-dioxygenase n=1 Tax=Phaeoacremonium minimum (strain UCR-PA7) TaxID=1286976 RepID=R8BWS5_PHAM7|nr:putative homogentisate -dioxygenase protein [Phaeoacremonium minimum UCRPA7]EOO03785.1 putative homogentisate -dioxygenase protein [Phaeoacremonium minimum UCRPA7]
MEKFINAAMVDRDQADPTLYTVLTAKSKHSQISLTDFLAFTPKWNVTSNTFRPPYYHRNKTTEIMGVVYGAYGGSSKDLRAGGLSLQPSYMPHGETAQRFAEATGAELKPERSGEGSLFFMFHVNAHCAVTRYALERSGALQVHSRTPWEDMEGGLYKHIEQINKDLRKMGLDPLSTSQ